MQMKAAVFGQRRAFVPFDLLGWTPFYLLPFTFPAAVTMISGDLSIFKTPTSVFPAGRVGDAQFSIEPVADWMSVYFDTSNRLVLYAISSEGKGPPPSDAGNRYTIGAYADYGEGNLKGIVFDVIATTESLPQPSITSAIIVNIKEPPTTQGGDPLMQATGISYTAQPLKWYLPDYASDNGYFCIDIDSGLITVAKNPSFASPNVLHIELWAEDINGLTSIQYITVNVVP